MKTRYSDDRYKTGYVRSEKTDIRRTFARIRAELKAKADQEAKDAAEREVKVAPMRKAAK